MDARVIIFLVLLLLSIGGGAWWYITGKKDEKAAETPAPAPTPSPPPPSPSPVIPVPDLNPPAPAPAPTQTRTPMQQVTNPRQADYVYDRNYDTFVPMRQRDERFAGYDGRQRPLNLPDSFLPECPNGYTLDPNSMLCGIPGSSLKMFPVCRPGYIQGNDNRCYVSSSVPTPGAATSASTTEQMMRQTQQVPTCMPGFVFSAQTGQCTQTFANVCPIGFTLDSATLRCLPNVNTPAPTQIVCPANFQLDATSNVCSRSPTQAPPQCSTGFIYSQDMGGCIDQRFAPGPRPSCPSGFDLRDNMCYRPVSNMCPQNYTASNGVCTATAFLTPRCPAGMVLGANNVCYNPTNTSVSNVCPEQYTFNSTQTECTTTVPYAAVCPESFTFVPSSNMCSRASSSVIPTCPTNYVLRPDSTCALFQVPGSAPPPMQVSPPGTPPPPGTPSGLVSSTSSNVELNFVVSRTYTGNFRVVPYTGRTDYTHVIEGPVDLTSMGLIKVQGNVFSVSDIKPQFTYSLIYGTFVNANKQRLPDTQQPYTSVTNVPTLEVGEYRVMSEVGATANTQAVLEFQTIDTYMSSFTFTPPNGSETDYKIDGTFPTSGIVINYVINIDTNYILIKTISSDKKRITGKFINLDKTDLGTIPTKYASAFTTTKIKYGVIALRPINQLSNFDTFRRLNDVIMEPKTVSTNANVTHAIRVPTTTKTIDANITHVRLGNRNDILKKVSIDNNYIYGYFVNRSDIKVSPTPFPKPVRVAFVQLGQMSGTAEPEPGAIPLEIVNNNLMTPNGYSVGRGLAASNMQINVSAAESSNACKTRCETTENCEFWARSTSTGDCYMYKHVVDSNSYTRGMKFESGRNFTLADVNPVPIQTINNVYNPDSCMDSCSNNPTCRVWQYRDVTGPPGDQNVCVLHNGGNGMFQTGYINRSVQLDTLQTPLITVIKTLRTELIPKANLPNKTACKPTGAWTHAINVSSLTDMVDITRTYTWTHAQVDSYLLKKITTAANACSTPSIYAYFNFVYSNNTVMPTPTTYATLNQLVNINLGNLPTVAPAPTPAPATPPAPASNRGGGGSYERLGTGIPGFYQENGRVYSDAGVLQSGYGGNDTSFLTAWNMAAGRS